MGGISHMDWLLNLLKKYQRCSRLLQNLLHPFWSSSIGRSWEGSGLWGIWDGGDVAPASTKQKQKRLEKEGRNKITSANMFGGNYELQWNAQMDPWNMLHFYNPGVFAVWENSIEYGMWSYDQSIGVNKKKRGHVNVPLTVLLIKWKMHTEWEPPHRHERYQVEGKCLPEMLDCCGSCWWGPAGWSCPWCTGNCWNGLCCSPLPLPLPGATAGLWGTGVLGCEDDRWGEKWCPMDCCLTPTGGRLCLLDSCLDMSMMLICKKGAHKWWGT